MNHTNINHNNLNIRKNNEENNKNDDNTANIDAEALKKQDLLDLANTPFILNINKYYIQNKTHLDACISHFSPINPITIATWYMEYQHKICQCDEPHHWAMLFFSHNDAAEYPKRFTIQESKCRIANILESSIYLSRTMQHLTRDGTFITVHPHEWRKQQEEKRAKKQAEKETGQ